MNKKKLGAYLLTVVGIGALAAGGTYAWHTSKDQVVNHFEGGKGLRIEVNEAYVQTLQLAPAETVNDVITVSNTGKVTATVKADLNLTGLTFETDVESNGTGNGNLVDYTSDDPKPTISLNDINTWVVGDFYANANNGMIYKAVAKEVGRVGVKATDKTSDFANYTFELNAVENDHSGTQTGWTYEVDVPEITGDPNAVPYEALTFTYQTPLKPGEKTEPLLKSVSLNYDTPNAYKGSLLNILTVAKAEEVKAGGK